MEGKCEEKRMKILCLHGFRTSGSFLKKQISKWDPSIFAHFHMEFPDGLYPAGGKSDIEGIFPPPYFEWFQFDKDFTEEQHSQLFCWATKHRGRMLQDHPPFKLFVSISGSKFRDPSICEIAYKDPIHVRSVHFIGAKDWLRLPSQELAAAFLNPLIINHPQGHTVPRLALEVDHFQPNLCLNGEQMGMPRRNYAFGPARFSPSKAVEMQLLQLLTIVQKKMAKQRSSSKSSGNTASSAVDNCSKENDETKVVLKISGNTTSSAVDNCSKENGETKVVDDPKCHEAVPVAESGAAILKTEEAGVAEAVQA
ncbi:hypothetical protein Acr_00g0027970 [Actinidia rufa]|uniref:Serine hydrolase domain-containing protein n=1 Tax=Actinidia rufa TaxID=165716 RepID=A0A7J0DER4_9ERIC|nr:hypothetical protein Acr_00g0027970 [Actinidia rufa]